MTMAEAKEPERPKVSDSSRTRVKKAAGPLASGTGYFFAHFSGEGICKGPESFCAAVSISMTASLRSEIPSCGPADQALLPGHSQRMLWSFEISRFRGRC